MTQLPDASYALFKKKDGWFFLRSSEQRKEKYRRGPFDEKEVARYMAWKNIQILNRKQAESIFTSGFGGVRHIISISDSKDPAPKGFKGHPARKIDLHFDDVPSPDVVDVYAPQKKHMKAVLDFGADIGPNELTLIHCNAGISRSSASALAIIAQKLGFERCQEAVAAVLDIKRIIHPNHRMVRFADQILGYNGRLEHAYQGTFQGSDLLDWISFLPVDEQ